MDFLFDVGFLWKLFLVYFYTFMWDDYNGIWFILLCFFIFNIGAVQHASFLDAFTKGYTNPNLKEIGWRASDSKL